jgi:DNA-binding response OmpR family regulator
MTANGRILLAEDDTRVREALADLLTAWGYEVETAQDGAEALEKAYTFHPALVISDLRMPRMGGAELVHELRVRHCMSSVIIFSGMEMSESEREELREVRFLSKPLNPTLLRAAIAQRLEESA